MSVEEMLGIVRELPHQLGDALWRVESAAVPRADAPGGLAVCGVGGSAIGGDLARAVLGDRARRPLRTVRDYALEPWAGADTLVLCSSYSGNTEETLACDRAAGEAGAPRVALITGGELARRAREEGVPVIGVPGGIPPRAAVAYMVIGALECAASCGAAPSLRAEIEGAAGPLSGLAAGEEEPRRLAEALRGRVPIVYGGGPTAPVARRWKTQLNENAKRHAFWSTLPEANHNELCAFAAGGDVTLVLLEDEGQHERIRRRIERTAEVAAEAGLAVERVSSRGSTPFERVMSLVLLGDLVSVLLAGLEGVDPTPVEALEQFKRTL